MYVKVFIGTTTRQLFIRALSRPLLTCYTGIYSQQNDKIWQPRLLLRLFCQNNIWTHPQLHMPNYTQHICEQTEIAPLAIQ